MSIGDTPIDLRPKRRPVDRRGPSTNVEDLPGDRPASPCLICDACGIDGT